jgi:cell division septum initiation protein DivIVA
MKPRILAIDTPVANMRQEIYHTLARLRAYPFLSPQVVAHEALLNDLLSLQFQEDTLDLELLQAEIRMITADEGIDYVCIAIASTVDAITRRDRKAPLYLRYFGAAPPSKLRRPVLGEQLAVMRTWVPSLTAQDSPPPLRPYGDQLAVLVPEADQAVQARSEAQRKRADFVLGARKAFVDRLNAQRQLIYGQLAEAAHSRPELGLASDFATPFFVRDTRNRQLSLSELEQSILRLRERLQRKEAELARRLEEEDLAAQQRAAQELAEVEAELSAADDELAAAERQRSELAARVAALREQTQGK